MRFGTLPLSEGTTPATLPCSVTGGGGGLFAASLADELQIKQAIIPINPAVFSAWGILNSDYREDAVLTSVEDMSNLTVEGLIGRFNDLSKICLDKMRKNGLSAEGAVLDRFADIRYDGAGAYGHRPLA